MFKMKKNKIKHPKRKYPNLLEDETKKTNQLP